MINVPYNQCNALWRITWPWGYWRSIKASPCMASSRQYCSGPHSQMPVASLKNMLKWIRMISKVAPFSSAIWSSMIRALPITTQQLHYNRINHQCWTFISDVRASIHLNIASVLLKWIIFLIMCVVRSVKCGRVVKMTLLCCFCSLFSVLWRLEEGDGGEEKLMFGCIASSDGGLCMVAWKFGSRPCSEMDFWSRSKGCGHKTSDKGSPLKNISVDTFVRMIRR